MQELTLRYKDNVSSWSKVGMLLFPLIYFLASASTSNFIQDSSRFYLWCIFNVLFCLCHNWEGIPFPRCSYK